MCLHVPLVHVPVGLIGAPQNLPVDMLNIEEPIRKPPPLETGAASPEEEEEILPKELPPLVETLKHVVKKRKVRPEVQANRPKKKSKKEKPKPQPKRKKNQKNISDFFSKNVV